MARPAKDGLDYYPLDVGFLRDKKVRLLRSEFGASSVLFVLYVFGKVYEGDGYFLTWDKDELLLAADELGEQPTYISEVLQGCLSRSLFDERVFQMFGVLTSAGIQRRYLRGCEKRDVITITEEYWLLNVENKKDVPAGIRAKLTFVGVSGRKNPVISPENPDNSPGNPESKGKERKPKETKEKDSKVVRGRQSGGAGSPATDSPPWRRYGPYGFVTLSDDEREDLERELGYEELERCISYLDRWVKNKRNKIKPDGWHDLILRCSREGWGLGRDESQRKTDDPAAVLRELHQMFGEEGS